MASKGKMRRVQLYLTNEQHEALKRLAEKRGVSMAQVVRDAVQKEIAIAVYGDPLGPLIGMLKDGDPMGSVNHDDIIYGNDIHRG